MVSIVITGNPGSGKSFLGNLLLQKESFVHRISPRAVTTVEECMEMELFPNQRSFVWNLQGMLEPNARNINRNRLALDKAIRSQPEQLFLYVVRPRSGCRLSWEDVAFFQQLWLSYNLCYESTLVLFNAGSEKKKAWQAEILGLFCHLLLLDPSKLKHVFVDVLNNNDPGAKKDNRSRILQQIRLCEPSYHAKTGEIQLEAEVMDLYRTQIEQQMVVFTQLKQDIHKLQQDGALLIQTAFQNEGRYRSALQELNLKDQEIIVFQEAQLNEFKRISALLKEQSEAVTQYNQQCEDMNTRYRQMVRKNRNVFRQLGNVGKMIYKKPLLALPIVATTVFVPVAAPALALSLGITTTVATGAMNIGVGMGSALIQKQNVGKGAITGLLGGLTEIPCINSGLVALVNKQNVGAVIMGSLASSTVSFSAVGMPGSQIAAITAGSCTTALIADPKNVASAVAQSFVNGFIGSMAAVKFYNCDEKTKQVKEIKEAKIDVQKQEEKRRAELLEPSIGKTSKPKMLSPPDLLTRKGLTDFQASNPSDHSNHHNHQTKSKIVLSRNGMSLGLNGFNVATTGAVGATKTHNDGSSTGVGAVASDIFVGGVATIVRQTSAPTSSNPTNSIWVKDSVLGKVTTHETVGVCLASRTTQFQQMDALTGSTVQVVEKQEHFNVEGCLGDPAKIFVGTAAVLMTGGTAVLVAPFVPTLFPH
jgi:fluoride ion exporter CrcB/FEX